MLILASKSPRRNELLHMVGVEFTCIPAVSEEKVPADLPVSRRAEFLARHKALEVAEAHPEDVVIGSDTLVLLDGKALGKPGNVQEAEEMIRALSGRTHVVSTGVAICSPEGIQSFTSETEVEFYELTDAEIRAYAATGEPMDKAGGYGIQGLGSMLVKGIRGDYFTVVGFPLAEVIRHLPEEYRPFGKAITE